MCIDIFEREFTWGEFGNTWEIYKNAKESVLMIELIKKSKYTGLPSKDETAKTIENSIWRFKIQIKFSKM